MDLMAIIKRYYLIFLPAAVILVLGILLFVFHKPHTKPMDRLKALGNKNVREDPYDRVVKNQILKISPSIKKLYQAYTGKDPAKREGAIIVDWSIDMDGKPERVEVVASDFSDRDLEFGIVEAIRGITFPEPPVRRHITHTFRLKDTEKGGEKR
jgi:hypothetical protein